MVRSVKNKYGAWLATYYDDFTGARAIANDDNVPSATVAYDKDKTHYGNPMNGEAILNPRFRWSNNEMNKNNGFDTALIGTDDSTKELSNRGSFEWLSLDTIRQKASEYEGRAQLQYPDGNVGNKWRFDASGSDAYTLFSNGHDSLGKYIVPLGNDDSTFGRATMNNFTVTNYDTNKNAGIHTQTAAFVQRAHLAGVWLGETTEYAHKDGGTAESPRNVFQPVKSPSGQPFLVVQSFHAADSSKAATIPSIAYDGSLNSVGDDDVFTVRFAVRAYNGATSSEGKLTPTATVKLGYTSGAGSTVENGLTGTPKIQWEIDLSSYNTHPFKYAEGTGTTEVTEVQHWIDLDFVLDYSSSKFKVYQDGTEVTSTNSLGGSYSSGYALTSATPANMYGWEMEVKPASSQTNVNCVLMLDRAAMYRPLTDHPDGRELPPLQEMKMNLTVDGFSTLDLRLTDEPAPEGGANIGVNSNDYAHDFLSLFNGSSITDIYLLLFTNPTRALANETHTIDRPTWIGIVEEMIIDQEIKERGIKLKARDKTSLLDRQIPLWEVGQKGLNADEETTLYWLYDAQGMKSIMNLGATPLKTLSNRIGFDVDDDYKELKNQRLQLNSGHPIQMYNNEDTDYGPNNVETQYEGAGILGFGQAYSSGGASVLKILFKGNVGWVATNTFDIRESTSHNNTSAAVQSYGSGTENGNQYVTVNKTFVPATPKILYAGSGSFVRVTGGIPFFTHVYNDFLDSHPLSDDPTGEYLTFALDTDPNLNPNETIYVSEYTVGGLTNSSMATMSGLHKVKKVTRIWNYYSTWATQGYLWIVDTFTECASGTHLMGTYTSNTGLVTDKGMYSSDKGVSSSIPAANDKELDNKAVHAVWMRDLPKSLWFQYHFGDIQNSPTATANLGGAISYGADEIQVSFTSDQFNAIPDSGIGEIDDKGRLEKNRIRDKFIYKGKVSNGGNYFLVGVSFLSNVHSTTYSEVGISVATQVHICNISSDYKHLWLLWSDMRNNGKADADAEYRKQDFGLLYPTNKNYEVTLSYTDQDVDFDGKPDRFTELKLGEEIDIWNIDSSNDPSTNGAFSKPPDYANAVALTTPTSLADNGSGKLKIYTGNTGSVNTSSNNYIHLFNTVSHDGIHKVTSVSSNTHFVVDTTFVSASVNPQGAYYCGTTGSEQDETQYQDWEDKGGSFLVIDSSKFFNMNTLANGGKTGQFAGGKTTLGDYIATIKGYPTLIDNYWAEIPSNAANTASPYAPHPNADFLINEAILTDIDITIGDFFIELESTSGFDAGGGFGIITGIKDDGETQQTLNQRYLMYDDVLSEAVTGTLTGKSDSSTTFTLTDSSATFQTDGVKEGMYIKNTTAPLTDIDLPVGTPDSGETLPVFRNFRIKSVDSETQLTVQLMYYIPSDLFSVQVNVGLHYPSGLHDISTIRPLWSADKALWANGNGYEIPIQLSRVTTNDVPESYNLTPSELADRVANSFTSITDPFRCVNTTFSTSNYDTIQINTSLCPLYLFRLMMDIDGYVRSPNMGTFWDSDKFRTLWNAALMQTWMPQTRLPVMFDINNVPITTNMTTYSDKTSNDSYGSIVNSKGKTLWDTIKLIKEGSGVGYSNGLPTTFSYLCGKDGRIEYRPKYNSGHALNRDNIKVNSLKTNVAGQISHVRLYYANGQSFIDYPEAALTDTTRWKVIEHPDVTGDLEALTLAKKAYNSLKESRLVVRAEPIRDTTTDDMMLSHGRFGYLADPYRAIQGYNNEAAGGSSWSSLATGGAPFCGMINGLDGNMKYSTDIYNRYGDSEIIDSSSSTVDYDENYYFYGANSLSYAVQIVHVPAKCPLVSGTTGEELRVGVHLSGGTGIDDAQFTIGLYDYAFSGSATAKGGSAPVLTGSLASSSHYETVDAVQSGFYEIKVPDSYDSDGILNDGSIVISFNADYCRALLRHRCGDGTNILKNAHDITGYPTFSTFNTKSIFPLGLRQYEEMSSFAEERTAWYAPRIHITYDYTYTPATYVKYTDAGLGLSNETMVIQRLEWKVSGYDVESLDLQLERDESLSAGGILAYLFPTFPANSKQPRNTTPVGSESGQGGSAVGSDEAVGEYEDDNTTMLRGGGADQNSREGGNGQSYVSQVSVNQFSPNFISRIKGRMALDGDKFAPQGEFGILGGAKPSRVASSMMPIGITGMSKFIPTEGPAVKTADGISLPAGGFSIENSVSVVSEIMGSFVVPSHVVTDEVGLVVKLNHGANSKYNTTATLYAEIECVETGSVIAHAIDINSGIENTVYSIIAGEALDGASTKGNTLVVKIRRRKGLGSDDSDSAILIKDIMLNQRLAALPTASESKEFSQYS